MEHGTYKFAGSRVDVKPVVTSDGDSSSPIGANGTGEYKELRYNMLSMSVKVTSKSTYVNVMVCGSGHDAVSAFGIRNEELPGLNALDPVNCCN